MFRAPGSKGGSGEASAMHDDETQCLLEAGQGEPIKKSLLATKIPWWSQVLHSIWLKLALVLLVAGAVGSFVAFFPWEKVPGLLLYMQEHPGLTIPLFGVVNAVAVLVLLPGAAFQMVGGAVYGLWAGWLVSYVGTCSGVLGAFLLAKYMFKESMSNLIISRFPHYGAVEAAIFKDDGWKLVWLLRLTPGLPDSLLNYAMGLTSCGFGLFSLASCGSLFGYAFLYAYLGHASRDIIATIRSGEVGDAKLRLGLTLGSVLLGCCTLVYLIIVLRRALHKVLVEQEGTTGTADEMVESHPLLADQPADEPGRRSDEQPLPLSTFQTPCDHTLYIAPGGGGSPESDSSRPVAEPRSAGPPSSSRSHSPSELALSLRPSNRDSSET